MTKDERIQGLLEANNTNVVKRHVLAQMLRDVKQMLSVNYANTRECIDNCLADNGPS